MANKLDGLVLFDETADPIDFTETVEVPKKATVKPVKKVEKVEDTEEDEEEVEVKFKAKKSALKKPIVKKEETVEEETEEEEDVEEVEEEVQEAEEDEAPEDKEALMEKFNSLKDLGYLHLPENYQFDGTEESLEKAIQDSEKFRMKDAAVALWEQLPESFKPLLEYALKGGTDINKYKEVFVSGADADNLDLTEEENQRAVIRELYKQRGFSDAKILKDLARIEDSGDLEDEALEAAQELRTLKDSKKKEEYQRVEAEKRDRDRKEQEAFNILKGTLEDDSHFHGYTIPPAKRNEVLNSLYRKVRDEEGNFTTDFNYKLNKVVLRDPKLVLVLSDLMTRIQEDEMGNKYFDFSHINKKAESEAAKKLKKSIDVATSTASKTGGATVAKSGSSKFDWESVII